MNVSVHMVDVFGSDLISGNPLAVIVALQTLAAEEMQRLTRWFNLSETSVLGATARAKSGSAAKPARMSRGRCLAFPVSNSRATAFRHSHSTHDALRMSGDGVESAVCYAAWCRAAIGRKIGL